MPNHRKSSILISGAVVVVSILVYLMVVIPKQQFQNHHVNIHGMYLSKPLPIGEFSFQDNHGKVFTVERLQNKWSFVFFGFTHCEMVCPLTLGVLNKTLHLLQDKVPRQQLPQVIFITVDPERDSKERLNQYLHAFNPDFIGARSSIANTRALENQFRLPSASIRGDQDTLLNHSPEILLINPKAEVQAYFSYPPKAEYLVKDYLAIVNRYY